MSDLADESHGATYFIAICISLEIPIQGDLSPMPPTSVDIVVLQFIFRYSRFGNAIRLKEIAGISY